MADRGYTFWGTCKGTTKAGTPCKHIVVYANGYCRAHGGDSTEFMRERFAKIKAKAQRRAERLRRRRARLERLAQRSTDKAK
jgi:hypothetical protein